MTPELIGVIIMGAALVALNVALYKLIEKRLDGIESRIDRVEASATRQEDRVSDLARGAARLEGLLDGVREALFGRARTGV